MERPTLEQEKRELREIQTILATKEKELGELHRICNSLKLMGATIQNSIMSREAELTPEEKPKINDHKTEVEELKGE